MPGAHRDPRGLAGFVNGHALASYFLLAYALSWTYAVIAFGILQLHREDELTVALTAAGFTLIGPTLAAFVTTGITQGRGGMVRLLSRYALWRVRLRWYTFVLLFTPILLIFGYLVFSGDLAAFQPGPAPVAVANYLVLFAVIMVVGGPLGEEVGWRGTALPRLQRAHGPLVGTLVLGVLWGLWHLPLFLFIPGYDGAGSDLMGLVTPLVLLVVVTTAASFLFTWVFNNVRGSILLMMLFHATLNTSTDTVPTLFPSVAGVSLTEVIPAVLAVIAAAVVLIATRGRLNYERYRREAEALDLNLSAQQAPAPAGTIPTISGRPIGVAAAVVLVAIIGLAATQLWDPSAIRGSFDVGGRSLYLECVGEGGPTVVMEAGSGGDHSTWERVVAEVRSSHRTCTYDRANTGASSPVAGERTSGEVAADLHRLLGAADIEPPYMLVGHSLGGISMRLFASTYADEVVGLILVDATPTTFVADACAIVDTEGCETFRSDFEPMHNDGIDIAGSTAAIAATAPLRPMPVVVLAASDHGHDGFPPDIRREFEAMWLQRQSEVADSVEGGRLQQVESGHNIQSLHPEIVIGAISAVAAELAPTTSGQE